MLTIPLPLRLQPQVGALKEKVSLQPPCMCRPALCKMCVPENASLRDHYGMLPCCRDMRMT